MYLAWEKELIAHYSKSINNFDFNPPILFKIYQQNFDDVRILMMNYERAKILEIRKFAFISTFSIILKIYEGFLKTEGVGSAFKQNEKL